MSMSPSSGKASMKSSLRPLMLRKWTLKILPRSPNQRITTKISRAGSSSISATVPWQKLSPGPSALVGASQRYDHRGTATEEIGAISWARNLLRLKDRTLGGGGAGWLVTHNRLWTDANTWPSQIV